MGIGPDSRKAVKRGHLNDVRLSWSALPGPSRFLEALAGHVRDGRNTVLCLPAFAPSDFRVAVRQAIGDGFGWYPLRLDATCALSPLNILFDTFVPDFPPAGLRTIAELAAQESFQGRIIWVEDLNVGMWPLWRAFLTDYAQVCRSGSLYDRTVFIVVLHEQLALTPPDEDTCLVVRRWEGVVDSLDMDLYTSSAFAAHDLPPLLRRAAAAMAARTAVWDLALATDLADADLIDLFAPQRLLAEFGARRGWRCDDLPRWEAGTADSMYGVSRVHSALLAGDDPTEELSRRLWAAQVSVLFPYVEERRRQIIDQFRSVLKIPFESLYGRISDVRDLEIGHLHFQFASGGVVVDRETRETVRLLKIIRDRLAHLEPLTLELLRSDEVNRTDRSGASGAS